MIVGFRGITAARAISICVEIRWRGEPKIAYALAVEEEATAIVDIAKFSKVIGVNNVCDV